MVRRTPWVVKGSSRSIRAWNSPLPPLFMLARASVLRVDDILGFLEGDMNVRGDVVDGLDDIMELDG